MKIFVNQNLHKLRQVLNDILGTGNAGEHLQSDPASPYGLKWAARDEDIVDHGNIFGFHDDGATIPNATADYGVFTVNPTNSIDFGEL